MRTFQELGLQAPLLDAIKDLGFEQPSEIQQNAIPALLEHETDMVSLAQTGTGKTAAFGFPLLQKINSDLWDTQGLILSPTRELCLQITNELKLYAKYLPQIRIVAVYGGASITEQASQLRKGAHIIVATPGRMQDMINRRMAVIDKISYCVLDEADEMLNMGFLEDIQSILSHTPKDKNTWLFSATMPKEVALIAKKFMKTPVEITVGQKNAAANTVEHLYYVVQPRHRYAALKRLADAHPDIFSLVFCRTKRDTQSIAEKLIEDGYNAAALHGDLSQNQRDLVMKAFRNKQIQMLVATDVAARGIDVDNITHVIHYQLPDDIETYNHRSGRTGRAGKTGTSLAIVTKSEVRRIKSIERIIQKSMQKSELPSGMDICENQLLNLANKVKETPIHPNLDPYLPALERLLKKESREDLIKKFFSVEFARFYDYYARKDSQNISDDSHEESGTGEGAVRFFINLGERDGFSWMTLKDFLRDLLQLGRNEIFKVNVKNSFSFFSVEEQAVETVVRFFENFSYHGRSIRIEASEGSGGFGGGKPQRTKNKGRQKDFNQGDFGKSKKKKRR